MAAVHQSIPPPPAAAPPLKQTLIALGAGTGAGGCGGAQGMAKDSRWLTLEVCREYARNKCTRTEDECRFAHPPSNVEVQNGRVMCCFDSIKGRCQRTEPPCKYLHPPQHLKEQLLQNGRNNLLLRNFHWQTMPSAAGLHPFVPAAAATVYPLAHGGYLIQSPAGYASYYPSPAAMGGLLPSMLAPPPLDAPGAVQGMLPMPSNGMLPALPSSEPATSSCQTNESCSTNGIVAPSGVVTNGHQNYWPANSSALSSAYYSIPTGTTYYSPTAFFQGVSTPGGMVPLMKGPGGAAQSGGGGKNGLTMYACTPASPYQPAMALTSMQSCYHPMSMGGGGGTGGPPQCSTQGSIQRY